jgi:hypothetical protein
VTAASWRLVLQHEVFVADPGAPQSRAIARQQSACLGGCLASRQAETGNAVQKTTTASISNAPFLPQDMVSLRITIVSIRPLRSPGCDLDHAFAPEDRNCVH